MTATHSNKPPNNGLKPGITSSKSTHMLCSPCSKIKMHGDKPYLQSGAKTEHAQHCPDPELYMVSTPTPAALQARVLWPAELVLHRGVGSPIPACQLKRCSVVKGPGAAALVLACGILLAQAGAGRQGTGASCHLAEVPQGAWPCCKHNTLPLSAAFLKACKTAALTSPCNARGPPSCA